MNTGSTQQSLIDSHTHSHIINPSNLSPALLKQAQQDALRAGFKAGLPTLPGIAAWGMVVGIAMIKTDFTIWQALGMSLLVFAGSAQLAALPLIVLDAPLWIIFATSLVINLRFVIFSVILAPHFSHLSWRQRTLWSYLSADISVVLFIQRYPSAQPEVGKFEYLKGLLVPNWAAWQMGAITGILLGSQIPTEWGIGYAGTLAILCILLPMILNQAALIGVIVAGATALLTAHWPYKLGVLFAIILGMVGSMLWAQWQGTKDKVSK